MSVTVKAFLHRRWNEAPEEIRRFTIDQDVTTSYAYLVEKIAQAFPSLRADNVIVNWIDNDGDRIVISSDEELLEALGQFDGSVFRLFLKKRDASYPESELPHQQPAKEKEPAEEGNEPAPHGTGEREPPQQGEFHPHVVCDGCHGPVYGNRYKCLVCSDYDLCSSCEAKGLHTEHNMVTIENPWSYSPWGFQHPWARCNPHPRHCGRRGYPRFGGRGHPYHWGRGGGFPHHVWSPWTYGGGVGCCSGSRGKWFAQQSATPEKEKAGRQEPMETEQSGEKGKEGGTTEEEQAQLREEQRRGILHDIGEAVSSFLEPFGVKVDFDVLGSSAQSAQEPKRQEEAASAPPPVPSGATVDTTHPSQEYTLDPASSEGGVPYTPPNPWVPPTSGEEVPSATSGETLPGDTPQTDAIGEVVAQLQSMGFDDEGGWLTELVNAKGGEIERVLDVLHPNQSS